MYAKIEGICSLGGSGMPLVYKALEVADLSLLHSIPYGN